jgi:hypothetical protein
MGQTNVIGKVRSISLKMIFQNLYVLNTQCNIPITETNASTIKKEKKRNMVKKNSLFSLLNSYKVY